MKKIAVISVVAAMSLFGSEVDTVLPFGGYIGYGSKSVKDKGYYSGVYISGKDGTQQVELQYSYVNIKYDDNRPDLNQNDYTFVYSNYGLNNYIFRAGIHYLDSDDLQTDKGVVLFGGIKYYRYYDFDAGVDVYYTHYKNFDPSLDVWQISPSVGKYFAGSIYGDFYIKGEYNYITFDADKLTNVPDNSYSKNYHSAQLSVTNYYKKFITTGYVWFGKQAFAVRDSGFNVYNLTEKHRGGTGLKVNYILSKNLSLSLNYSYEKFTDTEVDTDTHSSVVGASFSYTF